jgi:ribonuclease E
MSRQRIRTGVLEGSTVQCPHCMGAGVVRSTSSIALFVLRVLEDGLIRASTHDMIVRTRTPVALYILNQKRAHLRDLERRFGVTITVENDDSLSGSNYHSLERGELATGTRVLEAELELRPAGYGAPADEDDYTIEETPEVEEEAEIVEVAAAEDEGEVGEGEGESGEGEISAEESERRRRRRRRRRRGGAERSPATELVATDAPQPADDGLAVVAEIGGDFSVPTNTGEPEEGRANGSRRRRSRRGRRGERLGAPSAEGSTEELNAGDEFEPEGVAFDPESQPPVEGEAESEPPMVQPELPWHLPLAAQPEPEAVAPEAQAPAIEAVALEAPVVEAPLAETSAEAASAPEAAAEVESAAQEAAEAEPALAEPIEPAEPIVEGPPRPRRSGWWQRAKATVVE